jgi:hypothetical protein
MSKSNPNKLPYSSDRIKEIKYPVCYTNATHDDNVYNNGDQDTRYPPNPLGNGTNSYCDYAFRIKNALQPDKNPPKRKT